MIEYLGVARHGIVELAFEGDTPFLGELQARAREQFVHGQAAAALNAFAFQIELALNRGLVVAGEIDELRVAEDVQIGGHGVEQHRLPRALQRQAGDIGRNPGAFVVAVTPPTVENSLGSILQKCKVGSETTFKVLREGQELLLKAILKEKE